jgi:hypothetical protein
MKKAVGIAGLETIKDKKGKTKHAVTFLNNFDTWKKEHPKFNLTVLDARSFKELPDPMAAIWDALRAIGQIDMLLYSGHSDSETLYVISRYRQELEDSQRFIDFDSDWSGVKFSTDAKIYLEGCQAGGQNGKKFDVCIAQNIADKTGVKVFAYVWKSSQKEKGREKYYQLPEHGGFVEFTTKTLIDPYHLED